MWSNLSYGDQDGAFAAERFLASACKPCCVATSSRGLLLTLQLQATQFSTFPEGWSLNTHESTY